MTYAHITGGIVDQVGSPPALHFDGTRWWDLRPLDPALLSACGWLPLIDTPRPADTATTTWERGYSIGVSAVTVVWAERPKTAGELAAASAESARTSLDSKLREAVQRGGTLDTDIGTALAWTPGTPLTLRGYAAMTQAQIKALTLAQTQELLAKLAPLLVNLAVTAKRAGKLAVQLFDSAD